MIFPKIVILLNQNGIDSVTVSATDTKSRALGYEICKSIEKNLETLSSIVKNKYPKEEQRNNDNKSGTN